MASLLVRRTGHEVFINGIKLIAHIDDEEFQDESGSRREILFTFQRSDAKYFKEKDIAIVNNEAFKIQNIQRPNAIDPFLEVSLTRVKG